MGKQNSFLSVEYYYNFHCCHQNITLGRKETWPPWSQVTTGTYQDVSMPSFPISLLQEADPLAGTDSHLCAFQESRQHLSELQYPWAPCSVIVVMQPFSRI